MTTETHHAVLTDTHMVISIHHNEKRTLRTIPLATPVESPAHLYELGMEYKIACFWVMPDTAIDSETALFFDCTPAPYATFLAREEPDNKESAITFASVRKPGIYGQVYMGFPHRGKWGWNIEKPVDVLSSVFYLQHALGIPVLWSPGHLGKALLQKLQAHHKDWLRESTVDLRKLPFPMAARDVVWHKPLSFTDVGKVVYAIDENSKYLNACQSVNCGCGEPVHTRDVQNEKLPGIYHIAAMQKSATWDERELPPIINTAWVTSDVLQLARKHGYNITVDEAWQFEEYHQLLRPWSATLWTARATLKPSSGPNPLYGYMPGRQNAYSSIKEIAVTGVGNFASQYATSFLHANWWADVVGAARAQTLYKVQKLVASGQRICLINNDALWIVSDQLKAEQALPGVLDRAEKLGGYKLVYAVQVTRDMVEASQTLVPTKMVQYMHRAAGHKGSAK